MYIGDSKGWKIWWEKNKISVSSLNFNNCWENPLVSMNSFDLSAASVSKSFRASHLSELLESGLNLILNCPSGVGSVWLKCCSMSPWLCVNYSLTCSHWIVFRVLFLRTVCFVIAVFEPAPDWDHRIRTFFGPEQPPYLVNHHPPVYYCPCTHSPSTKSKPWLGALLGNKIIGVNLKARTEEQFYCIGSFWESDDCCKYESNSLPFLLTFQRKVSSLVSILFCNQIQSSSISRNSLIDSYHLRVW